MDADQTVIAKVPLVVLEEQSNIVSAIVRVGSEMKVTGKCRVSAVHPETCQMTFRRRPRGSIRKLEIEGQIKRII